jgi:hypothetical protein
VTLQINALDDAPTVIDPARYRSLTQERAIGGKHGNLTRKGGRSEP